MNNFSIKGSVYEICDEQSFSEKFKKRDLIIEVEDGAYKQVIKFQLINERCDLADKLRVGQEVTVHFNLAGRKYEKNGQVSYFTNLTAWRIETGERKPLKEKEVKKVEPQNDFSDYEDGLPF